ARSSPPHGGLRAPRRRPRPRGVLLPAPSGDRAVRAGRGLGVRVGGGANGRTARGVQAGIHLQDPLGAPEGRGPAASDEAAVGTRLSPQSHPSHPRTLDRRTLARDHRRLAALLRPGMAVLDVGAGTGAITAGIARAVAPSGAVLGIDRDETMIRLAREQHAGVANLAFELRDVLELRDDARFDVVTAARALPWIADPARALHCMHAATRPGGIAVVLEYTHADLVWEPTPPEPVRRFYDAFLAWRDANGWDNRLGDHLPGLFADAGFRDVVVTV